VSEAAQSLVEEIFKREAPQMRHLFASAITPRGLVNFTEAISRHYPQRYLLSGPPGCGKEKLLEAVAAYGEEQGLSLEVYHNGLLPQQIELLVLPEAGIALADVGESPRELLPEDTLINCGEFIAGARDAQAEEGLQERSAKLVEQAAAQIADAKARHDVLESYYGKAMDFEALDDTGNKLFDKILALTKQ
jgi:DNA polymerase III delta prime subunit